MSEWIITSSILILLIIGIRACFRNKIALRARYALWLVVALRLLVPLSISESSFSVLNFLGRVEDAEEQAGMPAEAPEEYGNIAVAGKLPEEFPGEEASGVNVQNGDMTSDVDAAGVDEASTVGRKWSVLASDTAGTETDNHYGAEQTGTASSVITSETEGFSDIQKGTGNRGGQHFSWKAILFCTWGVGFAAIAGIVLSINQNYRRRIYGSRTRYRSGVRSRLPVYITSEVLTPCMFGFLHPAVYLTPGIEGDDKALRYVLRHENTHYRHRDNLWALVRVACVCLHWYNPLVWLAAELSRQDCELACDETTLKLLDEGDRIDYGRTLLDFSVQSDALPGGLQLSTAVAGGKKQLKERLMMIVSHPRRPAGALAMTMALVMLVSAFTFTGRANGQEAGKEPAEGKPENVLSDAAYGNGYGPGNSVSNTSIVPVDLKDGKDYALKIVWEDKKGGAEYQIERMELNWIHDKTEETVQSIRLDNVRVLYTIPLQDIRENNGQMWSYTPEKTALYAKALRTAEDLPNYAAETFRKEGSGASLAGLCDGGLLVEDLNFDGYEDFCLQGRGDGENIPYYCYLWNPEERRFVPGYMVPNLRVDSEEKLIESATVDGEDVYSIKYYRFDENNTLHMIRYVEKNGAQNAVLPDLDLTYCETSYALPAVDEWDYGTRYGGALTERFVNLARQALTELYEWSGTKLETVCFAVTDGGEVVFGNNPKDMDASRNFYWRCYGEQAGFENWIRSMTLATERVVWFSPVTQWNVPENLTQMTNEEVVLWYFARSALTEGETAENIEESYENTYVIRTEAGNYYEMEIQPVTREISNIYGPYDHYPTH